MDNISYLNFIVFIVTTILYFLIKPDPDIKKADGNDTDSGSGGSYMMTGAYFLVVIITQFFINSYLITESCGGNVMSNLGESALYTFVPWTLIFGVVIITVIAYPDIKSAFSDVYGYYFVAGSAQQLLTELLKGNVNSSDSITNNVETVSNGITNNVTPGPSTALNATSGTEYDNKKGGGKKIYKGGAGNDEVSDLVLKIYGNMSILINQLTPSNFNYYWDNMLTPLFKDTYKTDPGLAETKKTDLLNLVITRDNIGEGMWYIYTGILICSLVQFKLSSVGCKSNQEVLAENYKKLKEEQKQKPVTSTIS
jgi:hypothetical protein